MRFSDYLRASVLLVGSAAFALLLVAAGFILREGSASLIAFSAAWIGVSVLIGVWLGRRDQVMESTGHLLSRSRPEPVFPKIEPAALLMSRLWPVLVIAIFAALAAVFYPQLAVAASGCGVIWSLAWRKQAMAVEAIEDRDAVHFWIVKNGTFKPPKLVRVPAI